MWAWGWASQMPVGACAQGPNVPVGAMDSPEAVGGLSRE